jgi:hypothetical protein
MLFYVAEVFALLGDRERAFARLEQAVDSGFLCAAAFVNDAYFKDLRSEARWQALMARLAAAEAAVQRVFDQHRGRALLGL